MDFESYSGQELAKVFPDEKKAIAHLAQKYKITKEDYIEMEERQKGKCKICGVHKSRLKRRLNIDHCHITGEVRGLLCTRCNITVGFVENCKLDKILDYIKDNKATTGEQQTNNKKTTTEQQKDTYKNDKNDKNVKNEKKKEKGLFFPMDSGKPLKFTPPTAKQVEQYAKENNYNVDPKHFISHYETKGWMLKTGKMKKWQAAVVNAHYSGWCKKKAGGGKTLDQLRAERELEDAANEAK